MQVVEVSESLYMRTENALDTIRPYLATDGGNVKIVEITDEGVLHLELLGSCGTCPMSAMTMKAGIEEAVRRLVPEISHIQAVKG
jgi:Fe-S cluster biogenesis protein NfuA